MHHRLFILSSRFPASRFLFALASTVSFMVCSCGGSPAPAQKEIVQKPEDIDKVIASLNKNTIAYALDNAGKISDSVKLKQDSIVADIYQARQSGVIWMQKENWIPAGDSLISFIENARLYGLFPEDYHASQLLTIRNRILADTSSQGDKKDAALWSRADLMLTDAFVQIVKDIKIGRLPNDSISFRKDSVLTDSFYNQQLEQVLHNGSVTAVFESLEPQQIGYRELRSAIKSFLDSARFKDYTFVAYTPRQPAPFKKALQERLFEENYLPSKDSTVDSLQLSHAIKRFQQDKGLEADGVAGEQTVRVMNISDKEKFIRIALTLDKYKLLPQTMPTKYVMVNLPGYYLRLIQNDTVLIFSKIVCGKPLTRTPELNSSISEMITYPQWTIPTSIIVKEILPGIKKDSNYLAKKGYSLIDDKGDEVNPSTVAWGKYSKGIPYKVVQGSGDDNALGVYKFNFPNKYSVYLHDTNQRYYFGRTVRSLSHGCVRVQEWDKLAFYILRNDSLNASSPRGYTSADSVRSWLQQKVKRSIPVRNRIPLFIRYFTCAAPNGKLVFYDDIYDEDKKLSEKYFADK